MPLAGSALALLSVTSYKWIVAFQMLIRTWVGLCTFQDPVGPSNGLCCKTGSFSHCHNPHRFLLPEVLRLYFPHAGTLGCMVCLTPQLFLTVYLHASVGPPGPPAVVLPTLVLQPPPCHESSPPWLPISTPPTGLDECFFFNSLVVGLLYSLIFWKFWLFCVF